MLAKFKNDVLTAMYFLSKYASI